MAQVKVSAVTVTCSNCRTSQRHCVCGEPVPRLQGILTRWLCLACGTHVLIPRCDCYLLYDIEVNGVLTKWSSLWAASD